MQYQYQQGPPPRQSRDKGCFEACIAALCCCFVCEEGCDCVAGKCFTSIISFARAAIASSIYDSESESIDLPFSHPLPTWIGQLPQNFLPLEDAPAYIPFDGLNDNMNLGPGPNLMTGYPESRVLRVMNPTENTPSRSSSVSAERTVADPALSSSANSEESSEAFIDRYVQQVHLVPVATYLDNFARRFNNVPTPTTHSRNTSIATDKTDDGLEDQENVPPPADRAANVQNTIQDPLANMYSQIAASAQRVAAELPQRGYMASAFCVMAGRGQVEMDEVSLHEEEAIALMVDAMTGGAFLGDGLMVRRADPGAD